MIRLECDKRFRELIDRSFVEEVSESERRLMHDHLRNCDGCKRYVELTARAIRGLREFTFATEPDSNAQVLEILAHQIGIEARVLRSPVEQEAADGDAGHRQHHHRPHGD